MYGNGYDGYSMSNNARAAYDNDEKPISKWTKEAMLRQVNHILEDITPQFDRKKLEKLPVTVLRDMLLRISSWHHTSKYYNVTDFYEVSPSCVEELTDEKMESALQDYREHKKASSEIKKFRGDIYYLEWGGTRRHPKAYERELCNVNIEIHGSTYVVKDDAGKEILRKRMGSNGTWVINYEEEERKRQAELKRKEIIIRESSPEAYEFFLELDKNGCETSMSGHVYKRGRKPSRAAYEAGLENFLENGEKRLAANEKGGYDLEIWNGAEWVKESFS